MPKHYYQIGEVANMLNIKKHTLRYWETEFPMLKPRKNRSGKRSYTLDDIEVLKQIKYLLYDQNYSIEGAKKKLAAAKKEHHQIEMPFYSSHDPNLKTKLKGRLAKIQEIIEVTPDMAAKIQKKEKIKTKINKIFALMEK